MKKKDRRPVTVSPVPSEPAPPVWKSVLGWSICVWLVFVVLRFENKFPVSFDAMFSYLGQFADFSFVPFLKALSGYFKSLMLGALFVVGSVGCGHVSLPTTLKQNMSLLGLTVVSFLVGAMEFSFALTGLGFLKLYHPPVLLGLLIGAAAVSFFLSREFLAAIYRAVFPIRFSKIFASPASVLVVLLYAIAFSMAFVPELFYDALVYHLGLPQMFVNEGRIVNLTNMYPSRAPMLVHMLYVMGVGLDGSTFAKLINQSFFIAGLAGITELCRVFGWRRFAPWACLFVASIPVVQLNIWSTAIDASIGSFLVMTVYCLWKWSESESDKVAWACLVGLFAGACFAIKYPGVVVLMLTGVLMLFLSYRRVKVSTLFLSGFVLSVVAAGVVSPWLVRNYVWTGNPVYPIGAKFFESRGLNEVRMMAEKDVTKTNKPKTAVEFVTYPWRLTFLEISNFNFVGPLTLGLLPLVLLLNVKERSIRFLALASFGYFALQLQFLGQIRYLMAGFFLLSVLLAGGLSVVVEKLKVSGWFVRSVIVGIVVYQMGWIFMMMEGQYHPLPLLFGKISRNEYSATMHNGLNLWPWNVMKEDLEKLPEPCRIYILGNEQVFGFPKRFWYSSVHDWVPLVLWANASTDGNTLYEKMKSQGFTHLLVNVPETMRLEGYNLFPWNDTGRKAFTEFADQHLNLVNVKGIAGYEHSVFLFELKEQIPPQPFGQFGVFFRDVFKLGAK